MIIECSHCHARYQYDAARFEGKPSKKIRCAKCHEVFEIQNPDLQQPAAAPEQPESSPPPPAPPPPTPQAAAPVSRPAEGAVDHDSTQIRRKTVAGAQVEVPEIPASQPAVHSAPLELPQDRRYSLAITDGADSATVFRIEKVRVSIGRAGADIALNDTEASREHAAIAIHGTSVHLEDLGSTNGTFVDGRRIEGSVEIQNQQEFLIGNTTLMLIVTPLE